MTLKTDLRPTGECLEIDRCGEALTDAEKAHVQGCARCEAELALWREFEDSKPAPGEGAAVQWIVSELHRRNAAQPAPAKARGWFPSLGLRPVMGLATALVLTVAVGYLAWDPEPRVGPPAAGEQVYRAAGLDLLAPIGDVRTAPGELVWIAADGAASYDVQLLEVDRTVLWRAPSISPRVALPETVVRQIVPGKSLLWEVTAIGADGGAIASATQRFRVVVDAPLGRP